MRLKHFITVFAGLTLSYTAAADICPDVTADNPEPQGWSLVAMSDLDLPGEFFSARYITHFGLLDGLLLCDYTDQQHQPFYLMSNEYIKNPNPHDDKTSNWIPHHWPFSHLLCDVSRDECEF